MLNHIIKRNIFNFAKNGVFESLLPSKSDSYFRQLMKEKQTFYLGVDPTATSLQIGNLFPLIALLRVWKSGNNIIFVVGGGTAQIGDPTDRLVDRVQLSDDVIACNSEGITGDIKRIINNFQEINADVNKLGNLKVLNNRDWFGKENLLKFVTTILSRFRFDDVKNKRSFESRLSSETSITLSEFLYPFLQARDWLHLYQQFGCKIQIGGDDQTGNMQLGQILIDRLEKVKVYGLTVPLFCINGEKIGKSNSSFKFWLNPEVQSPYSLHFNITHVSNGIILNNNLLKRLTLMEDEDIEETIKQHESHPKSLVLQNVLADQIVTLVHGSDILSAVRCAKELFSLSTPQSIEQKLASINESKVLSQNSDITHVPHIGIDPIGDKSLSVQQLIDATNQLSQDKIDNPNSIKNVKFNGEHIEDFHSLLNGSALERKICGVLQIGSSNKWIVHFN